uniref:Uncharacterized protein n=1 Tax=Anguilla anguilla TaxID=7936 RepID=A0A0E9S7T5_ANGAN
MIAIKYDGRNSTLFLVNLLIIILVRY